MHVPKHLKFVRLKSKGRTLLANKYIKKGDIILKYTRTQTNFLRRKGYLNKLEEVDEF